MSNPSKVFVWILGVLTGAALAFSLMYRGDEITGAHGVLSPCGFFNIVTIHADGTHRSYNEGPPAADVMAAIEALPEAQRSITPVPCPTMQVPQREAKSQNPPDPRQARETREASGHDPDGTRAG